MFPGMEGEDPRMAALQRAMGGMPEEEAMPEPAPGAGDPQAQLMDIAMQLESLMPQLPPEIASQIAPLMEVLRSAGGPKPEGVPPMGDEMMNEGEMPIG